MPEKQPMAWAVHCPGGKEFDYVIFPERDHATSQAMAYAEEDRFA